MTSDELRAILNDLSDSELSTVSSIAGTILRGRRRARLLERCARGEVVPLRDDDDLGPGCIVFDA